MGHFSLTNANMSVFFLSTAGPSRKADPVSLSKTVPPTVPDTICDVHAASDALGVYSVCAKQYVFIR